MESIVVSLLDLHFRPITTVHVLAVVVLATILFALRRRLPETDLVHTYELAVWATLLWTLFEGAETMSTTPRAVRIWLAIQSLGFGSLGPLWFLFADRCAKRRWVRRRTDKAVLILVAAGTVLIAWTNPVHHSFWKGFQGLCPIPGPAVWVVLTVHLGLVVLGFGRLLVDSVRNNGAGLEPLVLGLALLSAAGYLVGSQAGSLPSDLTGPAASVYAVAQLAPLMARLPRLGSTVSLEVLFDTMDTAVASFLVDGTLLEQNRRFKLLFSPHEPPATLPAVVDALGLKISIPKPEPRRRNPPVQATIRGHRGRWLDVRLHAIAQGSRHTGWLLQIQDVTEHRETAEALRKRERELEEARAALEEANKRLEARAAELEKAVEAKAQQIEEQHQQLLHAQKMESLGTLAGGIAHDFNNVLFSLIGYADLILENCNDPEEVTYCAQKIKEGAERATDLTKKLLGFARRERPRFTEMDLAGLVRDVVTVLRRTVEPRIQFKYEIRTQQAVAVADPQQMHQVLMNLCLNAVEAISGSGLVTIRVDGPVPPPKSLGSQSDEKSAGYLRIQVVDTGCGMTEEVRARVFEPFFTTKSRGKGTGLGLSLVYGIIKDHQGTVEVESAPGKGTTFTLYLPAAEKPARTQDTSSSPPRYRKTQRTFDHISLKEHRVGILVVDDNPEVLALTKRYFEEPLFQVWTASTGEQAVQIVRRYPEAVDVVLLDLVLPDIPAKNLVNAIRTVSPELVFVIMSGYNEDDRVLELMAMGAKKFLKKPFTRKELRAAIRTVIEE